MGIQFIVEVYVCKNWKKKLYGLFLWTGFTYFKVLCYHWAIDYFHCYLNQITRPLSSSSYILRIEKDWEYLLDYSNDLLIQLIEKSDTLSYKPFLKHYFLETSLHVFLLQCLCKAKSALQNNRAVFYICLIWFEMPFGVTVLKMLRFWCSFCKVIRNQEFFSYSRYNLLGIATILWELSTNVYFR